MKRGSIRLSALSASLSGGASRSLRGCQRVRPHRLQAGYRLPQGMGRLYTRAMTIPAFDLSDTTDDERIALAIERRYRDMAAGTLRHKPIRPERLALIFASIAEGLLDTADDLD